MKTFVLLVALSSLAIGLCAQTQGWPEAKKKTLYAKNDLRGKKAPDVVAETWLSGKAPDTKGKVVLVDLWATWCGPCRKLIPEMNEWAKKFGDKLVIVGISDEPADTVRKFMGDNPMNYHVGVDTKRRVSNALGVEGIPHVIVISPDGMVRWQGFPGSKEDPLTTELLESIIKTSNPR